MRILLVNSLYYPTEIGGAERMVRRLADGLREVGHQPEVVSLATSGDHEPTDVDGMPVHRIELKNVYPLLPIEGRPALLKPLWHAIDSYNTPMARALDDVVARVQPDVVHTHNITGFSPLIWAAVARRGIPIVHTLHDHYLLCLRGTMFAHGKPCATRHLTCAAYSGARLRFTSRVTAVIGVSRFVLDRHLRYDAFSRAKIRAVIRNPAERVDHGSTAEAPAEFDGALRIAYLGRLESAKGIDVLLDACAGLTGSSWNLAVAGQGVPQYERELRARFTNTRVHFVGQVQARTFLRDVDVLVVPSRTNESLPMVVAEAFAAGVPVIASRVGGLPEIIDHERTGFFVAPGVARDLSLLLERLVAQPQLVRAMRPACLRESQKYAPVAIAGQYSDVYHAIRSPQSRGTP